MNRQYIGARYVPIYTGNWDKTKTYEALSIVTHEGGSFTSIVSVPAGIEITNKSYWIQSGSYNGYIADLQNRVNALETPEKHYLFVGDSYGVLASNWVNILTVRLGLTTSQYTNLCVSGAGFVNGNKGFLSQLTNFSGDRTKVTNIIICGGANDAINRGQSNFAELVTDIIEVGDYISANYQNAKTFLGFIGDVLPTSQFVSNHSYYNLEWAKYCYTNTAMNAGMIYLSGVEYALHVNPYGFSDDGLHPSASGSIAIANAIYNALDCSYHPTYPPISAELTGANGYTLTGQVYDYDINGDVTHLDLFLPSIKVEQETALPPSSDIIIGKIGTCMTKTRVTIPVELQINSANGEKQYIHIEGALILDGANLILQTKELNVGGTGYKAITMTTDSVMSVVNRIDKVVPTALVN